MKSFICVFGATILLCALPSAAAIILSQVGDDLRIDVENSITFQITRSVADTNGLGVYLDKVIDTVGDGGFILTSEGAAPSILSPAISVDLTPRIAVARRVDGLEFFYFSRSSMALAVGDAVTITAGELMIPDFFSSPIIAGLSKSVVEEAIFAESGGLLLSDPTTTAIPEPSILSISACGLLLCLTRRNRRQ